eukprot:2843615-Pleurochrysis_carterae.AAC.2
MRDACDGESVHSQRATVSFDVEYGDSHASRVATANRSPLFRKRAHAVSYREKLRPRPLAACCSERGCSEANGRAREPRGTCRHAQERSAGKGLRRS